MDHRRVLELIGILWRVATNVDETDYRFLLAFIFWHVPAAACCALCCAALKHCSAFLASYQLQPKQRAMLRRAAAAYQKLTSFGPCPVGLYVICYEEMHCRSLIEAMRGPIKALTKRTAYCYVQGISPACIAAVTEEGETKPFCTAALVLYNLREPLCEWLATTGVTGKLRDELQELIKLRRRLNRDQLKAQMNAQLKRLKLKCLSGKSKEKLLECVRAAKQHCIRKGAATWRTQLI